MEKHNFKITISGSKSDAQAKVEALLVLASHLDAKTLTALAKVVKTDPSKVQLAKQFLGL
jgi:hypothetical protein